MAVPDFQSLMLPLLRIAADGKEHSVGEARGVLSAEFKLGQADLEDHCPAAVKPSSPTESLGPRGTFRKLGCSAAPGEGTFSSPVEVAQS